MSPRWKLAAALAGLAWTSGCSGPIDNEGHRVSLGRPDERERFERADSSKVIAAELAFARAAQEKGQWTAFADFADDDAVMFVPQTVNAKDWLRRQTNPAQAVRWQPHQVWSSCDGSLAVTKGAWQRPDGSVGYFTTVWERQRNGEYRWVMDQGDVLAQPLAAPEFVEAKVADCDSPPTPGIAPVEAGGVRSEGIARDRTLHWKVDVRPDGARTVEIVMWLNGAIQNVLNEAVAAGV